MGLFGSGNNQAGQGLMPTGLGSGPSTEQAHLFSQAAQDSGLASMGMGMVDQMTGSQPLGNEDQVQLLYHLMAAHPNQMVLFFLHYPNFMQEFSTLISMVVKKELYTFFSSEVVPQFKVNPEKGAELGYSTLTDENIEVQIGKVIPLSEMQMEVNNADMRAMQMMGGHQQQMVQNQWQQQQAQQQYQQQYQQQMMQQPQQQQGGFGAALGGFGSSLIRGTLGMGPASAPAQQMPMRPQY